MQGMLIEKHIKQEGCNYRGRVGAVVQIFYYTRTLLVNYTHTEIEVTSYH